MTKIQDDPAVYFCPECETVIDVSANGDSD